MSALDKAFDGSIPAIYDSHLVPLIFEDYAEDLARRCAVLGPARVLETAAGTGVVTRRLSAALDRAAGIVATDLNPAMLAQARARHDDGRTEWREADATALPFDDAGFDAVLCQFGVMFFPDRVRGYGEARRVLRDGGAFLFNIWDGLETNLFPAVVAEAVAGLFPDDPPGFLSRTPHSHGNPDLIERELREAGFTRITIDALERPARAPSARHVAVAFCQGTPLRAEIEARGPGALEEATGRAAAAVAARWGLGPVEAPVRAYVIEAR